jgi:hypothetical protein
MDVAHWILLILAFLAFYRVGKMQLRIKELEKGLDLKNNRIDRMRREIDLEVGRVNSLANQYQELRKSAVELAEFVEGGGQISSSNGDEVVDLVDIIKSPVPDVNGVRTIRFRRSKSGEQ